MNGIKKCDSITAFEKLGGGVFLDDVEKEKGMFSERKDALRKAIHTTTSQHVWNELFFPFSELFHYHFYYKYMRKLQMIF